MAMHLHHIKIHVQRIGIAKFNMKQQIQLGKK